VRLCSLGVPASDDWKLFYDSGVEDMGTGRVQMRHARRGEAGTKWQLRELAGCAGQVGERSRNATKWRLEQGGDGKGTLSTSLWFSVRRSSESRDLFPSLWMDDSHPRGGDGHAKLLVAGKRLLAQGLEFLFFFFFFFSFVFTLLIRKLVSVL
jgi:hypothetical protein